MSATAASGNATTKVARALFELQTTAKLFHWKTASYAMHKASDELVEAVAKLGDELVETMTVRYGLPDTVGALRVAALNDTEIRDYLQRQAGQFWGTEFNRLVGKKDTDLQSIRDDIVAAIHKALYLMTLH